MCTFKVMRLILTTDDHVIKTRRINLHRGTFQMYQFCVSNYGIRNRLFHVWVKMYFVLRTNSIQFCVKVQKIVSETPGK